MLIFCSRSRVIFVNSTMSLKPSDLQVFLYDNPVFGPKVNCADTDKYTVECKLCQHVFHSPGTRKLWEHLQTVTHTNYASVAPTETMTAKQVWERTNMVSKYQFLAPQTVNGIEMVTCQPCNVHFAIRADCTQVYKHSLSNKHVKQMKGAAQVEAERRELYLQKATALCPEFLAISNEDTPGCGANYLICKACYRYTLTRRNCNANLLIFTVYLRYFEPKHAHDLYKNACDHLKSDLHQRESAKRTERKHLLEQASQMEPSEAKLFLLYTPTGEKRLMTTPEKCQRKFCKRTIESPDLAKATQVAIEGRSINAVDTSMRGSILAHTGRTVSSSTVLKNGLCKAAAGN